MSISTPVIKNANPFYIPEAKRSHYVQEYLIESKFLGTVLDLGCGIGVNAIPLVKKGYQVIVMDKDPDAILECRLNEILFCDLSKFNLHAIVGDITEKAYPKNIDTVICVNTLPYIPSSKLKMTLNKIFQAIRPGGSFIGTLFLQPHKSNAQEVLPEDRARNLIKQSGFTIAKDELISDSHTLEFLAIKLGY